MESIITRLYRGDVYPEEQILPQSEEARAAKKACSKSGESSQRTARRVAAYRH